ncbi:MAG: LCP family protein [Trueperaceae bacterium]
MTRRRARLVSVLGLLVALAGLVGFWLTNDLDRKTLTAQQRSILGLADDDFHVSFVVAGLDVTYIVTEAEPVYAQDGSIINWNWEGFVSDRASRTDTVLYVAITGSDISMIAFPRDTFLPDHYQRINAVYNSQGADALRREVEAILGVPIDYYALVKLDIFKNLVDALGGVTVDVPYRMLYNDNAGGLHINFQPGPQHMDGEAASKFIRYRELLRGDIDRIENVKRLAYAMLARIKELNVRAALAVPGLIDTFFSDIETNASVGVIRELATRLPNLALTTTATLPVAGEDSLRGLGSVVYYDATQVNRFMAQTFGGEARDFVEAPDVTLLVTDRSGVPGVADWYVERLVNLGVPEESIMLRTLDETDGAPTRLVATQSSWTDADFFAELLNVGKQQTDRFSPFRSRNYQVELVLGADAEARTARVAPLMAMLEVE